MWEEDLEASSRRRFAWLAGGIVAVAALAAGWYWYSHRAAPAAEPAPTVAAPATTAEPAISHPIPAEAGDASALPALNDSDQLAHDSLAGVIGRNPVDQFVVPQNIVRHVVVTVDNLSRKKVAVDLRPLKPTPGSTMVATQGEITTLAPENYERYASLMRVVAATDPKALAVVYEHLYPLFQQSYEDLGYPGKYFNDRLVEVIDTCCRPRSSQARCSWCSRRSSTNLPTRTWRRARPDRSFCSAWGPPTSAPSRRSCASSVPRSCRRNERRRAPWVLG